MAWEVGRGRLWRGLWGVGCVVEQDALCRSCCEMDLGGRRVPCRGMLLLRLWGVGGLVVGT